MTVGLKVGNITTEIGASSFFHAFFSTVTGNLELEGVGTRFPTIMNRLYSGKIDHVEAVKALRELDIISAEFSVLTASNVIWDIDNRSLRPPWGDNISQSITDLSNYFVTSTGRDLLLTLREIFEWSIDSDQIIEIVSY